MTVMPQANLSAMGQVHFNGIQSRVIFCLWTGPELMSENRLKALWSIFKNTGRPVAFVSQETVSDWVLSAHPLHPAYPYLSSTHKADYLRCYLMHHYGGGYADIKFTSKHWEIFFQQIEASPHHLALGYQELAHGIPHVEGALGDQIRQAHKELIGLCAFIFKPHTELTSRWYGALHALLDEKLELLRQNPGRFPLDQAGLVLEDGSVSRYPLRWAEILGEILHPLFYEFRDRLIKAPIEPSFAAYR